MKRIYLEPDVDLNEFSATDVVLASIATQGDDDPYGNDKDWGARVI